MFDQYSTLAIIGFGPRGLSALESLCRVWSEKQKTGKLKITIFEENKNLGAGHVWNPELSEANRANVSLRMLENLTGRQRMALRDHEIPGFDSFSEWHETQRVHSSDEKADIYPSRATVGKYLTERAQSLIKALIQVGALKVIHQLIERIKYTEGRFELFSENASSWEFREVLLTIGHQETRRDDQISAWTDYVQMRPSVIVYEQTYPVERMRDDIRIDEKSKVAIRGIGLSMIDVCRALTSQRGGRFEILDPDSASLKMSFHRAEGIPKKLIAFSLDGRPPAPKPLNAAIDDLYIPPEKDQAIFRKRLIVAAEQSAADITFFKDAVVDVTMAVIPALILDDKDAYTAVAVKQWIDDDTWQSAVIQETQADTLENMRAYVTMAIGASQPSLDYIFGQVWRHCQPMMYKHLSHGNFSDEVMSEIIALDERFKRYSYGPPVESVQQLIALVEADVLDLSFVLNPEIEMINEGWRLISGNEETVADVMIDAVLDSPQVSKVSSPIITELMADEIIFPVYTNLGIETSAEGLVCRNEGQEDIPLAVLGRLAKGSVLGVDAILECFGPRILDWASGFLRRNGGDYAAVSSSSQS